MNKKLRYASVAIICLLISACAEPVSDRFDSGTWIDLSHSYDVNTPYWPTAEGFTFDTVFAGMTPAGFYYTAFEFSSAEHGGTHIDAPIHFAENKQTVDEILVEQLIGDAIVIDVVDSVSQYIDYQIGVADFKRWEAEHGRIPDGSIVLLRTGFGKFWPDRKKYMGTELRGPAAVALLHFPGLHPDAAQWLVDKRSIKAIGLDTPSIDYGRSSQFMSHRILMDKNIPAFENVANLDKLPFVGAYVVALPMKIKGGSGGPLRIIAHLPGR
jgi:kynurenine formamidase